MKPTADIYIRLVMQRECKILDQQINASEVFLHFYSSHVHLFVNAYGRRGVDIQNLHQVNCIGLNISQTIF